MTTMSRALAFASRWFDQATVIRVFEPLIADWQRDWQEAPGPRRWSALVRGLTAFVCAVLLSSPRILLEKTPAPVANRIVTRIARFALITTVLQTIGWAWEFDSMGVALLFIIPSILVLMFPFALVGAVDAIRCEHALPAHVERATVMKLGIVSVAFMVILGGFVVPAANQAFRTARHKQVWRSSHQEQAAYARRYGLSVPRRGLRELSTYELVAGYELSGGARYLRETEIRELQNRLSIAMLPVLLLWLRWRLLDLPRRRWSPLPPTVIAIAAFVGFSLLRQGGGIVERGLGLAQGTGVWSPFIVVGALLFLETWRRNRRTEAA